MNRTDFQRGALLGAFALLLSAGAAFSQIPDEFKNLKVLPKDIGKQELLGTMRQFADALGVRCTFCHVEKVPGDHNTIDWASDELEDKKTARGMIKMVGGINGELLPAATGAHDVKVSCVTCHRGLNNPATLDQVLLKVAGKDGVDAALAKYRELRERYYGSGSYDFGPEPLGKAAESLAQEQGNMDGALAMLDLNIEMNPKDADAHLMKAQLLLGKGDKKGAQASVNRALELDPGNRHALEMLEQLK